MFGGKTETEWVWVLVGVLGFTIGWFIPSRGFLDYQDPEYPEAHSIGN